MEQEFFEAFNIPKIDGHNCIPHNTIKNECEYIINGFTNCCSNCEHLEKHYPPIPPGIVLKLITILVKKHCNITLYWGLPKLTEQILKQCIRDKNDKEIQDQVRALFNAM